MTLYEEHMAGTAPDHHYMMLSRMQQDCLYYLGNGNRLAKHLWALDEKLHMEMMLDIYMALNVKPEWLTLADLEELNNQILGAKQ